MLKSSPAITFNITKEPTFESTAPQRVLLIGQQLTDASPEKVLITNVGSKSDAASLFGTKSMLTAMVEAFRSANGDSRLDVIPYNDAQGSTPATATLTFDGTATENGTITVYIQSQTKHVYNIGVSIGNTGVNLAASLESLINADDYTVFNVTNNSDGSLTLTAANAGSCGNKIGISFVNSVGSITLTGFGFNSGATDPTLLLSDFNQISQIRYQTIVYPAEYDKIIIKQLVDSRFNVTNSVLDGVAITVQSELTITPFLSLTPTLNSPSMVIVGERLINKTAYASSYVFEYEPAQAAYIAGIRALRLTENENITNYIISNNPDEFGGPNYAAIPYANTKLPYLPIIPSTYGWNFAQQGELNNAGISLIGNNSAENEIICGEFVTTYLVDDQGISDTTYKYLNTIDTASVIREFFVNNNKARYGQSVLTAGDIVDASQVNVISFNAYQAVLYRTLSEQPYSLTVAGSVANNYFKNNLSTSLDFSTGSIRCIMDVPIVTQLRAINAVIRITFNT